MGSVQISLILDTEIKLHCLITADRLPSSLSAHLRKTHRKELKGLYALIDTEQTI